MQSSPAAVIASRTSDRLFSPPPPPTVYPLCPTGLWASSFRHQPATMLQFRCPSGSLICKEGGTRLKFGFLPKKQHQTSCSWTLSPDNHSGSNFTYSQLQGPLSAFAQDSPNGSRVAVRLITFLLSREFTILFLLSVSFESRRKASKNAWSAAPILRITCAIPAKDKGPWPSIQTNFLTTCPRTASRRCRRNLLEKCSRSWLRLIQKPKYRDYQGSSSSKKKLLMAERKSLLLSLPLSRPVY